MTLTLYYIVGFHVEQGKALRIGPVDIYPEVWHLHPWDFAEVGALLSLTHRMVDFRTWEPSQDDIRSASDLWFAEQRSQPILLPDEEHYQFRIRRPL